MTSSYIHMSHQLTNRISLSKDQGQLCSITLDNLRQYVYDLKKGILIQPWSSVYETFIFHSDYDFRTNVRIVFKVNTYSFTIFKSFTMNNTRYSIAGNLQINNVRNSSTKIIDALLFEHNFNYTFYSYTNFNEIISISTTFSALSIVQFITIYKHTAQIEKLFFINNIVIFADVNQIITGYNIILKSIVGFPIKGKLKSVTFLDSYYYFVIGNSFIKTTYDQTQSKFAIALTILTNKLSVFSLNSEVNLAQNQGLNMLSYVYQVGSNLLYSFSKCTGNAKYNATTSICEPYQCNIPGCIICNFRSNICTKCNTTISPFVIHNIYSCIYPQCFILNCLFCYNTAFCSICNYGFVKDQLGNCGQILQSNINPIINYTNFSNYNNELQRTYLYLLNITLINPAYLIANKIPGSRKYFNQFFAFFANFDDIQLYNYHSRLYDQVMNDFFLIIQRLQNQKWSGISLIPFYTSYLNINLSSIQKELSFKLNYTQKKFIKIQSNSNGYVLNTLIFYCSNFIIIIGIFVAVKILEWFFSNRFCQYWGWIYLVVIFIEGNVQFMSYLMAFQYSNMFYTQYSHRVYSLFIIIISFMLIFIFITIYPIIRYLNGKRSKYLFNNYNINKNGVFYLSLQLGIRNIVMGLIDYFIQTSQSIQITYLLCIQLLFLILNINVTSRLNDVNNSTNIIKYQKKNWINLFYSFLRILLIFSLIINSAQDQSNSINVSFQSVQLIILFLFLCLMVLSILYQLSITVVQMIKKYIQSRKQKQKSIKSQNKQLKCMQSIANQIDNIDNIDRKLNKKLIIQKLNNKHKQNNPYKLNKLNNKQNQYNQYKSNYKLKKNHKDKNTQNSNCKLKFNNKSTIDLKLQYKQFYLVQQNLIEQEKIVHKKRQLQSQLGKQRLLKQQSGKQRLLQRQLRKQNRQQSQQHKQRILKSQGDKQKKIKSQVNKQNILNRARFKPQSSPSHPTPSPASNPQKTLPTSQKKLKKLYKSKPHLTKSNKILQKQIN